MITKNRYQLAVLGYVGAAAFISTTASAQEADASAPAKDTEEISEVVVTGFRASLQNSVGAKRENIAFTDSIYAEDIGKFPDLNLAESLQRIPGVQIARDFTGEGTSVAVRGLGKDFTQITLNGSPVETASDSNIDGVSQGRGIDLVLFPTELFRQLTVSKTPVASQTEGAVAANIDLRIARPFDEKGFRHQLQRKRQLPGIERRMESATGLLRKQYLGNRARRIRHPRWRGLLEPQLSLRRLQHDRFHHRGLGTTLPHHAGRVQHAGQSQHRAGLRQFQPGVANYRTCGLQLRGQWRNHGRAADGLRSGQYGGRHFGALLQRPELFDLAAPRASRIRSWASARPRRAFFRCSGRRRKNCRSTSTASIPKPITCMSATT